MLISSIDLVKILAAQTRRHETNTRLQHAAVMMILLEREVFAEPQTHLVLIMKTSDGSRHAGQIAFPGGKVEPGETSVLAAMRETQEEIGISPAQLEVLGSLGYFSTMTTGYDAAVFLARSQAPLQYAPQIDEVAGIFEIPVAVLWEQFDRALQIQRPEDMLRLHFHLPAAPYLKLQTPKWPGGQKHICIWGFTARVLQHFFHMKMLLVS